MCLFPACGGTIYATDSDPSGYVTSPNYPSDYPQNADCVWTIIVPNGEAVQIQFQDQFNIEPSDKYFYFSNTLLYFFIILSRYIV